MTYFQASVDSACHLWLLSGASTLGKLSNEEIRLVLLGISERPTEASFTVSTGEAAAPVTSNKESVARAVKIFILCEKRWKSERSERGWSGLKEVRKK